MNYSICKDTTPKETVKKIKSILEKLGIEVQEEILKRLDDSNSVTSVRIHLKNAPLLGSNGKGTNLENALASGYAEFIERLQGQLLFSFFTDSACHEPDEIIKNIDMNPEQLYIAHKQFSTDFYLFNKKNPIAKLKDNETVYSPFKSLKSNEIKYLPIIVLKYCRQTSNGMAAGNTYEEAMVQGLSEICERYSLYQVFKNKLSLPDIPQEYYIKYDNIKNLISYIEKQGYKVIIKDASLGKGLGVVCTIFEDIKFPDKKYSVFFGSHPYLPIAIERTLTEFLQGNDISNLSTREKGKYKVIDYEDDIQSVIYDHSHISLVYGQDSKIISSILNTNSSYEFKFNQIENPTNKDLLKYLTDKIYQIADDIYVKDYSYLGFPTVYINVPGMSDILDNSSEDKIRLGINYYKWLDFFLFDTEIENNTIESLYEAVNFARLSSVSPDFLALSCAIIMNDKEKIHSHIDRCINRTKQSSLKNSYNKLLRLLENYYKNGTEHPTINAFLANLSFEKLKNNIKTHPYYVINDKKTEQDIRNLAQKLNKLYKEGYIEKSQ